MAAFISASDEHSGSDGRGLFLFVGYVGPEEDWWSFFVPAWRERVLDGPPKIPYLHMTEIRSKEFRYEWNLSRLDAEGRVDEAVAVIDTTGSLYPIAIEVDSGHIMDTFSESKVTRSKAPQFEAKPFEPDYLCFLAYAHTVLDYDIPCQAADVLCWHAARFENAQEVRAQDIPDARRYLKLRNRKELWFNLTNDLGAVNKSRFPTKFSSPGLVATKNPEFPP